MDGFLASALAAFFGGALSFLSPCVLPLVPGYLCFAAGLQFSELSELDKKGEATARILPGALAFVGGFSAVFIALGAGAAAINPLLIAYEDPPNLKSDHPRPNALVVSHITHSLTST